MVRKLAFISPVSIKLTKNVEEHLNFSIDNVSVRYKHPVLYVERVTARDKEYVYIYCGTVTYVLMKVKPVNLNVFFEVISKALERFIEREVIDVLFATIELYSNLSHIIDDIYYESLRKTKRLFEDYKFSLLYFDFELRKYIKTALLRGLAKITLDDTIYRFYMGLPEDLKQRLTYEHFRTIVLTEISIKNIINALKRN